MKYTVYCIWYPASSQLFKVESDAALYSPVNLTGNLIMIEGYDIHKYC